MRHSSPVRRPIFKQKKRNRRQFDSFYQAPLLDFFERIDPCDCFGTMQICKRVLSLFSASMLQQAEQRYQQYKEQNTSRKVKESVAVADKILQPHLENLLMIVKCERIEPLYEILKHAKCQYLTFWTYAALCEHWPIYSSFENNVIGIVQKYSFDVQGVNLYQRIQELHKCKLANIIHENYLMMIRYMLQKPMFVEKVAAIWLVNGRMRQQHEIIKAALAME